MAKIKCHNCGKSINDKGDYCNYCGCEIPKNFFKVLLPSYTELGDKAEAAANFIARYKRIELDEAVDRLKRGRIVLKNNATLEQVQQITNNFSKVGIHVIAIDTRKIKKKKKSSLNIVWIFSIIAVIGLFGVLALTRDTDDKDEVDIVPNGISEQASDEKNTQIETLTVSSHDYTLKLSLYLKQESTMMLMSYSTKYLIMIMFIFYKNN